MSDKKEGGWSMRRVERGEQPVLTAARPLDTRLVVLVRTSCPRVAHYNVRNISLHCSFSSPSSLPCCFYCCLSLSLSLARAIQIPFALGSTSCLHSTAVAVAATWVFTLWVF